MRKVIATIAFCLITPICFANEDKSTNTVKEKVSDAVSELISLGKNTLSGIKDGIDEGHREGESTDGALIINDSNTLAKYDFSISINKINQLSTNAYELVMLLKNNEASPVRLKNIKMPLQVILLDNDGIATELDKKAPYEITVPTKAAIKTSWYFYKVEGTPRTLRLYNQDMVITTPINKIEK